MDAAMNKFALENCNRRELKALIQAAERRLTDMTPRSNVTKLEDDERVIAVANEILLAAYRTNHSKAEVFRAVAGALRMSMREVAPAGRGTQAAAMPAAAMTDDSRRREGLPEHDGLYDEQGADRARPRTPETQRLELSMPRPRKPRHEMKKQDFSGGAVNDGQGIVYKHPVDRHKDWNGQGEMPTWLRDALSFGRALEEFQAVTGE